MNPRQSRFTDDLPTDAVFALIHAAELAFATDQLGRGVRICKEIVRFVAGKPISLMQAAMVATIGAIVGDRVMLSFRPSGLRISLDGRDFVYDLGGEPTSYILEVLRVVIATSAALPEQLTLPFNLEWFDQGPFRAGLLHSDEAILANFPGIERSRERRDLTISRMVANYSYRLDVMRADIDYWNNLIPQGDLIDWTLLALLVGQSRKGFYPIDRPQFRDADGVFIAGLAEQLSYWG